MRENAAQTILASLTLLLISGSATAGHPGTEAETDAAALEQKRGWQAADEADRVYTWQPTRHGQPKILEPVTPAHPGADWGYDAAGNEVLRSP